MIQVRHLLGNLQSRESFNTFFTRMLHDSSINISMPLIKYIYSIIILQLVATIGYPIDVVHNQYPRDIANATAEMQLYVLLAIDEDYMWYHPEMQLSENVELHLVQNLENVLTPNVYRLPFSIGGGRLRKQNN